MTIRVTHNVFRTPEEAKALVAANKLVCLELDVPPTKNASHWHGFHAELYILDGDLHFTDVSGGEIHLCRPGTHIVVPTRSLHAESSEHGYRIVLGSSVPPAEFGDPVNRLPSELG